jgi:CBS-domain-containing membrane protein
MADSTIIRFKLVQNFADRGCHVVSVTDPQGRILGFLDRSRYFSF